MSLNSGKKPASGYLVFTPLFTVFIIMGLASCSKKNDIVTLGAKPDGQTLCTEIIQKAIDESSEEGGGTVVIPAGRFLTGTLILKSGVTLDLKKGSVLLGSGDPDDYFDIHPEFVALRTGTETRQLIYAEGQHDIAITGEGLLDGQGGVFKPEEAGDEPGITRPHLIQLINCTNVRIEGVSMRNSGGWMQHYLACTNLKIDGIDVYNHCNFNNDGLDIDGCRDVIITRCTVDSDDDGICLKSTSPEPCRNVIITGCVVKSHCNALKLGTESTGGFYNINITNCTVSPSADRDPIYGLPDGQSAISVEMVDGGILDGVNISHITVSETGCPVFIRLGNRARKYTADAPEPGQGILRNVSISDLVVTTSSKTTSNITGIPGADAENIFLSDILIRNLGWGTTEEANMPVGEKDKGYPTARMFGPVLPASGFFVRHVKNVSFNNVRILLENEEQRPAFVFHDVKNALITDPVISPEKSMDELIVKDNGSENIELRGRR